MEVARQLVAVDSDDVRHRQVRRGNNERKAATRTLYFTVQLFTYFILTLSRRGVLSFKEFLIIAKAK